MRKKIVVVEMFFWIVAISAITGWLPTAKAQSPTLDIGSDQAQPSPRPRQILRWAKLPIFVFNENGSFLGLFASAQLPRLPLTVIDSDFNDTRTRIRITVKLGGAVKIAYLDTNAAILSKAPPPTKGPIPSRQPATPIENGHGSTLGTVANTQTKRPLPVIRSVEVDRPKVIDTATLQAGATAISLFGIEGISGNAAQGLGAYLASGEDRLRCSLQSDAGYVCLTTDGTDVAEVALVNGAARAKPDAPDSYYRQQEAARNARRGVWAVSSPPPINPRIPRSPALAPNKLILARSATRGARETNKKPITNSNLPEKQQARHGFGSSAGRQSGHVTPLLGARSLLTPLNPCHNGASTDKTVVLPVFASHDATLSKSLKSLLLGFVDFLQSPTQADAQLLFVGHANGAEYPQEDAAISVRRADAVKQFLVDAGVSADRLSLDIHTTAGPQGLDANYRNSACERRVVIYLTDTPDTMTPSQPSE